MNATSWSFPGRENEAPAEIWVPAELDGPVPGVVIAGDLMARPGKGLAAVLGPALAEKGYVAISATPAANRDTKGFKAGTLSAREEEVERMVTALFERMAAPGKVNIQKLALVGHGVGGSVAVAEAAQDSRVGAVVAIAAPRSPEAYFPKETLDAWAAGKTARLRDPDDGTTQELSGALVLDWRNRAELDHSKAATRTGAQVVWIHGTADEVVPTDESRRAYWKHPEAGRRARLVEIAGAGHDFASPAHSMKLVEAVLEQLGQGLS
jgi:pimeloyl-ACP methyl ester carboxylesterase